MRVACLRDFMRVRSPPPPPRCELLKVLLTSWTLCLLAGQGPQLPPPPPMMGNVAEVRSLILGSEDASPVTVQVAILREAGNGEIYSNAKQVSRTSHRVVASFRTRSSKVVGVCRVAVLELTTSVFLRGPPSTRCCRERSTTCTRCITRVAPTAGC
jgi:hypothetical protein